MKSDISDSQPRLGTFLLLGAWFGLFSGITEAWGLLAFQRINWLNAARTIHEANEILWVSPFLNLILFVAASLVCYVVARIAPRLPILRITIFLFAAFTIYDWLYLTERLYNFACLLMAIGGGFAFQRWLFPRRDSAFRLWKRTLPWLAAITVLAFIAVQGGEWWSERQATAKLSSVPENAPNVVLIVFDALRADHVSSYGYPRSTSPTIDKLAKEGTSFDNAISTSSWSLPSHASLVTGRYQYEHGADNPQRLPWFGWGDTSFDRYPTVGEALQSKGYRTGAFSANRAFFTRTCGFGRGFLHFEDYFNSPADALSRTLYGRLLRRLYLFVTGRQFVLRKRADEVNQELLHWVDRDRQHPFFAMLNYFDVHDPYGGPEGYPEPTWGLKTTIDSYDAGLKYDDDMLAQLLHQLQQRGLDKNTIVIITSDHGESLEQHGLYTHGRALYWELVRVPLVLWYPGHVPAQLRVSRPVTNAAIPATIMDLIAGSAAQFPGPILSQSWKSPGSEGSWPIPLSEIARNPYPEDMEKIADQTEPTSTTGAMKSLVTPQRHVIAHEYLGTQIYDTSKDPGEQNNLLYTASGPTELSDSAASLQKLLGKAWPDGRLERLKSSATVGNGTVDSPTDKNNADDYYRLTATPGSTVTVEVQTNKLQSPSKLDPVLSIEDDQGQPLHTCRTPGDDHLKRPGIQDKTPTAFDDLCISDDIQSLSDKNSKLEIVIPANGDLYVHVIDWNQTVEGRKNYRLVVKAQ
jgi:hypothetical protein